MAQKKIKLFLSVRWWQRFTNERWERLIRTDALLSKAGVSCRRTCPVSYYSWQGSGEGMGNDENDFIILVYDRNNLYFSDCMHYMTQPRSQDSLLPAPMERERERPWKTLVTWLQDRIISEGGVLCLIFFCLVYWRSSRSDRNGKIDLTTTITETKGNFCLNKTIR